MEIRLRSSFSPFHRLKPSGRKELFRGFNELPRSRAAKYQNEFYLFNPDA
jgi:hypothetical protein